LILKELNNRNGELNILIQRIDSLYILFVSDLGIINIKDEYDRTALNWGLNKKNKNIKIIKK
jgi:hypothetical protein